MSLLSHSANRSCQVAMEQGTNGSQGIQRESNHTATHIHPQGWLAHTETSPKSSLVYHHNTNDSQRGLGVDFNNRREMRNTLRRKQRTTTVKKRNSTWHLLAIRAELQHAPLKLRAQIAQQLRAFLGELSNEPCLFQLFPNF